MKIVPKRGPSPAKEIAYIAIMTAILTGGQFALSMVAGVEVVTVLLLCFAFVFGPRAGALTAVAFSLLRCFIWGFYPSVIVLYIIYYPLFALLFGGLGRIREEGWSRFPVWALILADLMFAAIMFAAAFCAAGSFLKISRIAATMVKTLLWVIFGLSAALFVTFNALFFLKKFGRIRGTAALKLVVVAAIASVCTICFTLLDDVITPLFYGWGLSSLTTASYFYASFLALAPQTVCTIVTVVLFFLPLTAFFGKVAK